MRKNMTQTGITLTMVLTAVLLVSPALAVDAADGYALLVQQSPPDAGSINPGIGVHKMPVGQKVTLTATPKPGYNFLYWLGDVSKANSTDTSIEIDSPKMVVAVYAKNDYEGTLSEGGFVNNTAGGGGGAAHGRFVGSPMHSAGSVSPASGSYEAPSYVFNYTPSTIDDTDPPTETIPVPNDGTDVPEPATVMLMGLGGLALLKRRNNR